MPQPTVSSTSLAHLKTTMQMDVRHCKTVPGVLKELTVFAIVYNLVRLVMCQSAMLQCIGVERISVLDALRWLGGPIVKAGWARMAGRRAPEWNVVLSETAGAMVGPFCFGLESWHARSGGSE